MSTSNEMARRHASEAATLYQMPMKLIKSAKGNFTYWPSPSWDRGEDWYVQKLRRLGWVATDEVYPS